jgi:hypothetical protein
LTRQGKAEIFGAIVRVITMRIRPLAILGIAAVSTVMGASAGAAPTAVDVTLNIAAASQRAPNPTLVPNGGTATVTSLNFIAGTTVELITPQPASVKVRLELAQGLRWGPDLPDGTEGCTSTATSAECQSPELQPITGQAGWGWEWDVIAERAGSYVLRSAIIAASESDPDPSNDSASITVVVAPSSGGQPGGGGGSAAVTASVVKLVPGRPKAGKPLTARVLVTAGGAPVRPTRLACAGMLGKAKVKGEPKATLGSATCVYRTPKAAKGTTLRGTVSFTAGGTRFTKRFVARLR